MVTNISIFNLCETNCHATIAFTIIDQNYLYSGQEYNQFFDNTWDDDLPRKLIKAEFNKRPHTDWQSLQQEMQVNV